MPKTPTPEAENEPAGLVELRKKIAKMEADAAAARDQEAKLAEDAEKLRKQAVERETFRKSLEREIARAEREAVDQQRRIPPAPVTAEVATEVAQSLLHAFDDVSDSSDGKPAEQRADSLWAAIDDARSRLLTDQVDEDARAIVVAVEAVIKACDEWETARSPDFQNVRGHDGEPLTDIRGQIFPGGSSVVRRLLSELIMVLGGEMPSHAIEGIGELIGQNVSINQLARMHQLLLPDGSPDLETLGFLIDRGLGAAGFYREANHWAHIKRSGALNHADAWAIRSGSLERRREANHNRPGASQLAGTARYGRKASIAMDSPSSDQPTHLSDPKFAHYHRQKAAVEANAREDHETDETLEDF